MGKDDNNINIGDQSSEKWIIDMERNIFYRHLPRTDDFPFSDARLVYDIIGDKDIEIHSANLVLGPYRRALSQ